MALDSFDIRVAEVALEQVDAGIPHRRTFALREDLDALRSRVGALIKLAGLVLHCENVGAWDVRQVSEHRVQLWFREDGAGRLFKQFFGDTRDVIAVEQSHFRQAGDLE